MPGPASNVAMPNTVMDGATAIAARLLGATLLQAQRSCHIAQVEGSNCLVVALRKQRTTGKRRHGRGMQGHAIGPRRFRALETADRLERHAVEEMEDREWRELVHGDPVKI